MTVGEVAERTPQVLVIRFGYVVAAFFVGEFFASAKLAQFVEAFCCHGNLLDLLVSLICAVLRPFIRAHTVVAKYRQQKLAIGAY